MNIDMNTNLPPELVEKMKEDIHPDVPSKTTCNFLTNKCAQISVDYTDEKVRLRDKSLSILSENSVKYKRQRDELVEALKYIASADTPPVKFKTKTAEAMHLQQVIDNLTNKAKKSIENYECTHSSDKWCVSCYESKKEEIIGLKKHEYGKE